MASATYLRIRKENIMLITDEVIKKVENIFGFALYDWQVDYLKDKGNICRGQRANGKTFVYCLKLLLSDGEKIQKEDIFRYRDERSTRYSQWFVNYCLGINEKLVMNGIETRIV